MGPVQNWDENLAWTLYDTAHAVFRPRHMTAEELESGYRRMYHRLFSHTLPRVYDALNPAHVISFRYQELIWRLTSILETEPWR